MITKVVPLCIDTINQFRIRCTVFTNDEECCMDFFIAQYIQHLGCPLRIWSVVECQSDGVVFIEAPALDHIATREFLNFIVGEKSIIRIITDGALAIFGCANDTQNFASTFVIKVISETQCLQLFGYCCVESCRFAQYSPDIRVL